MLETVLFALIRLSGGRLAEVFFGVGYDGTAQVCTWGHPIAWYVGDVIPSDPDKATNRSEMDLSEIDIALNSEVEVSCSVVEVVRMRTPDGVGHYPAPGPRHRHRGGVRWFSSAGRSVVFVGLGL